MDPAITSSTTSANSSPDQPAGPTRGGFGRRQLRQQVDAAFTAVDPMGLLAAGAPSDEYTTEVDHVCRQLHTDMARDDVEQLVDEVMVAWLTERGWGPHRDDNLGPLVEQIVAALPS